MSDYSFIYIVFPLIIPFLLIYTYQLQPIYNSYTNKTIYGMLWAAFYISLGFILYKSDEFNDNELFWLVLTLLTVSYIFLVYTKYNMTYSFNLLFIMLALSFSVFIELLFANLIDDDDVNSLERGYVHLVIPSFVLVFYMFSAILQVKSKL